MIDSKKLDLKKFIGRNLGNVTLLSCIGEGAVATVFLGFQKSLKRQVAVKVLSKSLKTTTTSTTDFFRHEAELVATLSHPNIIPIYEMDQEDDCYFQVIQLIKGEELGAMLKRFSQNPLVSRRLPPVETTLEIILQVLSGLEYAHTEGVVHLDIKPSNILIEAKNHRVLIVDFGIASTRFNELHNKDRLFGTPLYMAPEYVSSLKIDAQSDIYATGIMLYKMLTIDLPLADKELMELIKRKIHKPETIFTMRPSQASPLINTMLEEIILKAIAPDPMVRYKRCGDLAKDLLGYKTYYHNNTTQV